MKRQALFSRSGVWASMPLGSCLGSDSGYLRGSNASAQVCSLDLATDTTIDAQPLLKTGLWSEMEPRATNRVAFMQPDASGYYRIYTMNPDGSDQVEICAARSTPGSPRLGCTGRPMGAICCLSPKSPIGPTPNCLACRPTVRYRAGARTMTSGSRARRCQGGVASHR